MLSVTLLSGCASSRPSSAVTNKPFVFQQDTLAYANQLVWEYYFDPNGKWRSKPREPKPDYTHHCFVVARSARQFFQHARFDPAQPVADEATYRRLIRRVISESPRRYSTESEKVVIPGYANLREFSQAQEKLLKAECGGAWESYFQRGHWRMVFPFSRAHQAKTAQALVEALKQNRPPVVHIVRFPQLTINHALLVFDATETETEIHFAVYDPNKPEKPTTLTYDRAKRTFDLPANDYFIGGRVDIYEVYRNWRY
ncbi:MAG: hypothetical protein HY298_13660 [Verrucomicrobia bacterium]|nr:hypothetical protein [Verrucomicrobiota bacterium]